MTIAKRLYLSAIEKYKNTISEIVQSTIDTLSNKNLLADINEQWETFTYKNETFLDTINGKYQQMAYQDAFKTAFDNTDSASAKKDLQELYDNNELTSAINRVVEDINHRFTIV